MEECCEIKRIKKYSIVTAYFIVSLIGFVVAFWTTNFVWMMLLVLPAVMCLIIAISFLCNHPD
jgi:hypothetical protein